MKNRIPTPQEQHRDTLCGVVGSEAWTSFTEKQEGASYLPTTCILPSSAREQALKYNQDARELLTVLD